MANGSNILSCGWKQVPWKQDKSGGINNKLAAISCRVVTRNPYSHHVDGAQCFKSGGTSGCVGKSGLCVGMSGLCVEDVLISQDHVLGSQHYVLESQVGSVHWDSILDSLKLHPEVVQSRGGRSLQLSQTQNQAHSALEPNYAVLVSHLPLSHIIHPFPVPYGWSPWWSPGWIPCLFHSTNTQEFTRTCYFVFA